MADFYEKQRQKQANYAKEQKRKQDEFVRQHQYKSQEIYESGKEEDTENYQKVRQDQQKIFDLQGSEKIANALPMIALILAILFPIMGIILGFFALRVIKKNPKLKGKGLAITAIVIGFLFTVFFPIFTFALMFLIAVLDESESCTFHDSFGCENYYLDGKTVTLTVKNNIPSQIDNVMLQLNDVCEPQGNTMHRGDTVTFKCAIPDSDFNGGMEMHYVKDGQKETKIGQLSVSRSDSLDFDFSSID